MASILEVPVRHLLDDGNAEIECVGVQGSWSLCPPIATMVAISGSNSCDSAAVPRYNLLNMGETLRTPRMEAEGPPCRRCRYTAWKVEPLRKGRIRHLLELVVGGSGCNIFRK